MSLHFSESRLYARSAKIDGRIFALSILRHTMEQKGQHSPELEARINELQTKQDNILRLVGYLD